MPSCDERVLASSELHVSRIYCKINEENHASLGLFSKCVCYHRHRASIYEMLLTLTTRLLYRLGYKECNYVAAFQEYELEITPKDHWTQIVEEVLAQAVLQRKEPLQ